MIQVSNIDEYVARAKQHGIDDAERELSEGLDRTGDDVIADTEELVHSITGKKLHEFEEDEDLIILLVETYDEAYIDAFLSGLREHHDDTISD